MGTMWDEVRADFPALARQIHLNAAAASPLPRPVAEAARAFYQQMEDESDTAWSEWTARREAIRAKAAAFIGAQPEEIAFVPNTSTGINLIVDLLAGDGAVLSDELEFPTVTLPWIHRGVSVHLLPAVDGVLRLESFQPAHAPKAATIAISHVQFSNGCRQDLAAFGAIKAHRRLVVSASQSCGAFPIDVKAAGVDALASAGQKWLCAGSGAGFVYIGRELLQSRPPRAVGWMSVERPFAFDNRQARLRPDARRTEIGCPDFAGIFALGAALEYIDAIGLDAVSERILELNCLLTTSLERAGFRVLSPGGAHRSGSTLVAVARPAEAARFLRENGIRITQKPEGVRISTHFYNNDGDIESCVRGLAEWQRLAGPAPEPEVP